MDNAIASHPMPWTTIILLCGKCSRKLDGGYGPNGEKSLRTALKDELKDRGRRRDVRIVETKCFGLCPKKSVVAVNAGIPGQLLTIPCGTNVGKAIDHLIPTA